MRIKLQARIENRTMCKDFISIIVTYIRILVLYVIIRLVIETQPVVVSVGRVLLHRDGAITAFPTSVVY